MRSPARPPRNSPCDTRAGPCDFHAQPRCSPPQPLHRDAGTTPAAPPTRSADRPPHGAARCGVVVEIEHSSVAHPRLVASAEGSGSGLHRPSSTERPPAGRRSGGGEHLAMCRFSSQGLLVTARHSLRCSAVARVRASEVGLDRARRAPPTGCADGTQTFAYPCSVVRRQAPPPPRPRTPRQWRRESSPLRPLHDSRSASRARSGVQRTPSISRRRLDHSRAPAPLNTMVATIPPTFGG